MIEAKKIVFIDAFVEKPLRFVRNLGKSCNFARKLWSCTLSFSRKYGVNLHKFIIYSHNYLTILLIIVNF